MSLAVLLKDLLGKDDTSFDLNPLEVKFLHSLLDKSPDTVNGIVAQIEQITSDGQIAFHEIPQLVLLIVDAFKSHAIQNSIHSVGVLGIVKFTIDGLLQSGLIPLPQMELDLIQKVIDTSLDLLKMTPDIPAKVESCCFRVFGWKL